MHVPEPCVGEGARGVEDRLDGALDALAVDEEVEARDPQALLVSQALLLLGQSFFVEGVAVCPHNLPAIVELIRARQEIERRQGLGCGHALAAHALLRELRRAQAGLLPVVVAWAARPLLFLLFDPELHDAQGLDLRHRQVEHALASNVMSQHVADAVVSRPCYAFIWQRLASGQHDRHFVGLSRLLDGLGRLEYLCLSSFRLWAPLLPGLRRSLAWRFRSSSPSCSRCSLGHSVQQGLAVVRGLLRRGRFDTNPSTVRASCNGTIHARKVPRDVLTIRTIMKKEAREVLAATA